MEEEGGWDNERRGVDLPCPGDNLVLWRYTLAGERGNGRGQEKRISDAWNERSSCRHGPYERVECKRGRAAQGEGEAERHRPRKKQIECNQLAQMDSSIPDEVKLTAAGVDPGVFDA